jgi:hypothetical protein
VVVNGGVPAPELLDEVGFFAEHEFASAVIPRCSNGHDTSARRRERRAVERSKGINR